MRFFAIASIAIAAVVSVLAGPVAERETPKSAAAILTDLSDTVSPLANQLLFATSENATQDILTPIIGGINTAVTNCVTSLKGLVGQPSSVILASVDGTSTLAPSDLAALLSDIVNLIFKSLDAVLQVVDSVIYTIISDLCSLLGQVIFSLIAILLTLVTGLLDPLLLLLSPVLSIIGSLGLGSLLGDLLGGLLGGLL